MADAQDVAASLEAAAKVIKAFTLQGMSVTFAPAGPATGQTSSNTTSLHNSDVNASSGPLNASTTATRATTTNAAVGPNHNAQVAQVPVVVNAAIEHNPNAPVAREVTSLNAGDDARGAATTPAMLRPTRQGTDAQALPVVGNRIGTIGSSSSHGTGSQVRNTTATQGQRHAGSSAAGNFGRSSSSSSLMATRKRSCSCEDGEVNAGRPRARPRVPHSSGSIGRPRRPRLLGAGYGDDTDPELGDE